MNKNNNNILSIDKCMEQVDMTDYYITKNIFKIISNKNNFNFLKNNIFLLAINNKNNKNSLIILLEGGKFKQVKKLIESDYAILNFKNINENNLFKSLLGYEYFYDMILDLIKKLERVYVIQLITCKNKFDYDFIDNIIVLLNANYQYYYYKDDEKKKILLKLIEITHNIYLLDAEKHTFLITKLCKIISNEDYLMDILNTYHIDNFDVYPDSNLYLCIDYLFFNEYFNVLSFLLDKINHIEFTNIDDNIIFRLCENPNVNIKTKSDIIMKILYKSNIAKFKNNKNQNIFYWLITNYEIDIKIIMNFIDYINIYEQDIYGQTLFDLIKQKYGKKKINFIKKYFLKQYVDKNVFSQVYTKINIMDKLIKSDIGIFTPNTIYNMIYTIYILDSNKGIIKIPSLKINESEINERSKLMEISNNEKSLIGYVKTFFYYFTKYASHLIVWKNKYNYWIDPKLFDYIYQNKSINFIHIKLTVYLMDNLSTRHSNVIIIDNVNKIVERFEPYGEIVFSNSIDINNMILSHIATPLGYKFTFVQPYPGFQSRSDEFAKYNKNYGDPMGFCLAWSFLYIDIKMELFKKNINANPIDFINWYIINKFEKDFNIDFNIYKTNKYILFIRFYAKYLDSKKNQIIKSFGLDPSLSYQDDIDNEYRDQLIDNINKKLDSLNK